MYFSYWSIASLVAQTVKNPCAMWETWVRSLGWEDPLEEGMATHSSILAWRIPWTEEPGGLRSRVVKSRIQLKRLRTSTEKGRGKEKREIFLYEKLS